MICPFCTTFFGESNAPSALLLPPSCAKPSRSVVLVAASCLYICARARGDDGFCVVEEEEEEAAAAAAAWEEDDDEEASAGPGRSGMGPRACCDLGFLGREERGGGLKMAPLGSE